LTNEGEGREGEGREGKEGKGRKGGIKIELLTEMQKEMQKERSGERAMGEKDRFERRDAQRGRAGG